MGVRNVEELKRYARAVESLQMAAANLRDAVTALAGSSGRRYRPVAAMLESHAEFAESVAAQCLELYSDDHLDHVLADASEAADCWESMAAEVKR